MKVSDYMCGNIHTITKDRTLADAIKQMVEDKSNSLIVVDESNKPIGLFSSRTIIRAIVPDYLQRDIKSSIYGAEGTLDEYTSNAREMKVEELMYKDFHSLTSDDAMIEAAAYMLKGSRRIIPVVDKESGEVVGSVTRTCLKNALYDILFNNN